MVMMKDTNPNGDTCYKHFTVLGNTVNIIWRPSPGGYSPRPTRVGDYSAQAPLESPMTRAAQSVRIGFLTLINR